MGLTADKSDWFFRFKTENPDEVAEALRPANQRGSFRSIDRSPFHFEAKATTLPRTGLFVTHSSNVWATDSSPRPFYYLTVPLTGVIRINDGRSASEYSPGQLHLLHKGDPFDLKAPEDQACMVLNAPEGLLESLAERLCSNGTVLDRFHGRLSSETPKGACFWRHLTFVWRELERSEALLNSPIASRETEEALLSTLLIALLPDTKRSEPSHPSQAFRRAEEYLAAHISTAVSMSDVAEAAGISLSTLFRVFRKHHGKGPLAFLRDRRLDAVRRALLAADHPTATVTETAMRYGFYHVGRFAAAYRAAFGESPSETLQR